MVNFNLLDKPKFKENYLCLMIGNSRLHWAFFANSSLISAWDSPHLLDPIDQVYLDDYFPKSFDFSLILEQKVIIYLASVVPDQSSFWQDYSLLKLITLEHLPLKNLYPSFGIDRALALWGVGNKYGFPCLVIDGGTALTFTGVNQNRQLIGGAILPGLALQDKALSLYTANLPSISLPSFLPSRWALNTSEAIASGIIYTALAGICDYINHWLELFPDSALVITGGDRALLRGMLLQYQPELGQKTIEDGNLIFEGMKNTCPSLCEDRN